jgi:hypothetical protein
MSRTINVKCGHCNALNSFSESELVSGVPSTDKHGNVVEEHPPVQVDANTVVACDKCGYPMSCANATIVSD